MTDVRVWCVVLAADDGPCVTSATLARLSRVLDEATLLAGPARVVTVLPRGGLGTVAPAHPALARGVRIQQPASGGSASELFVALSHVQSADPDAYVVVLPIDHVPTARAGLANDVRTALDACRLLDRVLVLGVAPRAGAPGREWILPGRRLARIGAMDVHAVETFAATPSPELATLLAANGGVWSARILAAPIDRLWMIGCSRLPEVAEPCRRAAAVMGTSDEADALDRLSAALPRRDLTRDLLRRVNELLVTGSLQAVEGVDDTPRAVTAAEG